MPELPDQLIEIQLSCIQLENIPINTWVLVGSQEQTFGCRDIVEMMTNVFRKCFAFMDHLRVLRYDSTDSPVSSPGPLFGIGPIPIGEYILDINKRFCPCQSWQFHNNEYTDRNCKHLKLLCRPGRAVKYTKVQHSFQLFSETVPNPSVYTDWIFSQKYDGIRVKVDGTVGWTRGGMKIDLSSIWTPPVGHHYDAELCVVDPTTSTHDNVMILAHAGKIKSLQLMIFDIIDDGSQTMGQRLQTLRAMDIPMANSVQYQWVDDNGTGKSFIDRLADMKIGSRRCEGVVVRNPTSYYDASGHRSISSFKVKSLQWKIMKNMSAGLQTSFDKR